MPALESIPRKTHLYYIGKDVFFSASHLVIATISTLCDCILLGRGRDFNQTACLHQAGVGSYLSSLSSRLIQVINPDASFKVRNISFNKQDNDREIDEEQQCAYDNFFGAGYLNSKAFPSHLKKAVEFQQMTIRAYYQSESFFEKEIGTRLVGPLLGLAYAVAGLVLTIFGVLATIMAIFTFGKFEKINSAAVNNLWVMGFTINQMHQGLIGFFRPNHLVGRARHLPSPN